MSQVRVALQSNAYNIISSPNSIPASKISLIIFHLSISCSKIACHLQSNCGMNYSLKVCTIIRAYQRQHCYNIHYHTCIAVDIYNPVILRTLEDAAPLPAPSSLPNLRQCSSTRRNTKQRRLHGHRSEGMGKEETSSSMVEESTGVDSRARKRPMRRGLRSTPSFQDEELPKTKFSTQKRKSFFSLFFCRNNDADDEEESQIRGG